MEKRGKLFGKKFNQKRRLEKVLSKKIFFGLVLMIIVLSSVVLVSSEFPRTPLKIDTTLPGVTSEIKVKGMIGLPPVEEEKWVQIKVLVEDPFAEIISKLNIGGYYYSPWGTSNTKKIIEGETVELDVKINLFKDKQTSPTCVYPLTLKFEIPPPGIAPSNVKCTAPENLPEGYPEEFNKIKFKGCTLEDEIGLAGSTVSLPTIDPTEALGSAAVIGLDEEEKPNFIPAILFGLILGGILLISLMRSPKRSSKPKHKSFYSFRHALRSNHYQKSLGGKV